ncbi:MAG: YceI family protein [Bacteroidia bacterium]|nr:YceI family protein [Bacteroidia bacterium]
MKTVEITNKTKWSIDFAHSEIAFKVRHFMITHIRGTFKRFDASIYTNGNDFSTAEVDLWIDPSSVLTGDTKRDEHLEGDEFFDVTKHKQINFVSNSIIKTDEKDTYEMWGELTILGIKKNIKLKVEFAGLAKDTNGNVKSGLTVTGAINRRDWGLKWNTKGEDGGLMVSDDVTIACELELLSLGEKGFIMELNHQQGGKAEK